MADDGALESRRGSAAALEMDILFVMTGAEQTPGGIATHNLNVLHTLHELCRARRGRLRVVSFLEDDGARPTWFPSEYSFLGCGGSKIRTAAATLAGAAARLVCFDHVTLALPLLPLVAGGLARTAIFAHGSESWRGIRRASRWSFQCSALTLANSQFTLNRMRASIERFNAVACPLGLSPHFPLNHDLPGTPGPAVQLVAVDGSCQSMGERMLLLVARMNASEREKGHEELLDVWPDVRREFPDAQLVFAGPGDDRERLTQVALDRGVGCSVFIPGQVTNDALRQLYRRCVAFVMPSRQEGFGLVYLEAMNYGKACVGCVNNGAEDVIVQDETGLLLRNPLDTRELFVSIRMLLRQLDRTCAMGEAGFRRLHAHFTSAHAQQRMYRHLDPLVTC